MTINLGKNLAPTNSRNTNLRPRNRIGKRKTNFTIGQEIKEKKEELKDSSLKEKEISIVDKQNNEGKTNTDIANILRPILASILLGLNAAEKNKVKKQRNKRGTSILQNSKEKLLSSSFLKDMFIPQNDFPIKDVGNKVSSLDKFLSPNGARLTPENILSLLILAQIKRTKQYDLELESSIKEITALNNYMKEINEQLSKARASRPNSNDDKAAMPSEVISFMKNHGLDAPRPGEKLSAEKYDQYILSIKGLLDDSNNKTQLKMVKLQRVISFRNQSFDFISTNITKILKASGTVIGNIRS